MRLDTAELTHVALNGGVPQDTNEGLGQRSFILWLCEETFPSIIQEITIAGDVGGDRGFPSSHCFQENDAEALEAGGWSAKDVAAAVVTR